MKQSHPSRRASKRFLEMPVYRRPSRRGGATGIRELSVSRIFRPAGYRRREHFVPYIRMSGRWLQRLGFTYGDRVEVIEDHGRISLIVVKNDIEASIN